MAAPDIVWKGGRFGRTSRRDPWWLSPSAVLLGLSAFLIYSTWAALQGTHYTYGPYISPFYSPELFGDSPHALFGPKPSWYPSFLPFLSGAAHSLDPRPLPASPVTTTAAPTTKSFWADPPACAVGEPRKSYLGERSFPLILQNLHRYFLRLSYIVWAFLVYDAVEGLLVSPTASASASAPSFWSSTSSCSAAMSSAATPSGTLIGGSFDQHLRTPRAPQALRLRQLPERQAQEVGLGEPVLGRILRYLRSPLLHGHLVLTGESCRWRNSRRFSYDVLVIGAGGAGLRAAIEAAATGVKVGVVCKSLLGKAHTVMAEGGVAAALANVDDRDNWRVHFADTMRGGQYLNNWRMAELHAKEAPDRVRELEAWGALFDRTKDGRILQRNFGGHRYPRLAHVGDRTGLEMIRTLQDHGIHSGMEVHMECTVLSLLMDSGRIAGAFGYDREKGHFILWQREGRRARHRRHRARLQDHQQQLGIHRRRPRAGLSRRRRTAWTWSSCSSIPRAWSGRSACAASW